MALVRRRYRGARGGCEAAAREGRRETSTLEKTEKALLIILSSFRTFTFFILWWKGRRKQPPEAPFSAANSQIPPVKKGLVPSFGLLSAVTLIIPLLANVANASPVAGYRRQSTMPLYLLSLGRSDWPSSGDGI